MVVNTGTFQQSWVMLDFAKRARVRSARPHPLTIADQKLVTYKTQDGRVHVAKDACPHRGAALHRGAVKGECIVCPYHDMAVGPTTHAPNFLEVVESSGGLWLDTASLGYGCKSRSKSLTVPPCSPEIVDPSFRTIEYTKRVKTNPVLMTENTLDWKHLASVHRFSLVDGDPVVTQCRDGINGMATYEYTTPAFDLVIENEYWIPFTTCLRFIFTDKRTGTRLKPLLLWFSLTPLQMGVCDLNLRISRATMTWMPLVTDQLFKFVDELPLWEDLDIVSGVDPAEWSRNKMTSADALVSAYRAAMLNHCDPLLLKFVD